MLIVIASALDSVYRPLGSGRWGLDAEHWTLDAGRWTLDAGRYTLDAGIWTLDTVIDWFRIETELSL